MFEGTWVFDAHVIPFEIYSGKHGLWRNQAKFLAKDLANASIPMEFL
ncbi:hypothetical protein Plhal304r1_c027g0091141 [Plasmopara halstedii]